MFWGYYEIEKVDANKKRTLNRRFKAGEISEHRFKFSRELVK